MLCRRVRRDMAEQPTRKHGGIADIYTWLPTRVKKVEAKSESATTEIG